MSKHGYHITKIPQGKSGEASKILEETMEFIDALDQKCSIMAIMELSDLYGAIELYLKEHHPSINMDDLKTMSKITRRSFENGHRQSKN